MIYLYFTLKQIKHTQKLWHSYVAQFAIAGLGHKYLDAAATLQHDYLNSCIILFSVWIMKISNCYAFKHTFSYCKREQNCEEPKWVSQSALLWPLAGANISCLNPKFHWFLASTHSTFNPIGSCNRNLNTQSHRDTYAHTTTYELFFQNSSFKTNRQKQNT